MTAANYPANRSTASLKLPLNVPALVVYAEGIVKSMTGNPAFPNPAPALAQVTSAITALSTAEATTLTRARPAVAKRDAARVTLHGLLVELKGYVQAAADVDLENSASIILGAGMSVRKTPARPPRVFDATPGPVAGSVKLVTTTAARRASYEWEYSADGGKTWVAAPPSLQSKTTVTGLPSATMMQFRVRAVTKAGAGDWTDPVSLVVQ
jgi:hypothetical protein